MASPLYDQFRPMANNNNNMLQQLMNFKKTINGDPKQMVQQLLNSGRVTQAQINQYAQQANNIYNQFKGLI